MGDSVKYAPEVQLTCEGCLHTHTLFLYCVCHMRDVYRRCVYVSVHIMIGITVGA